MAEELEKLWSKLSFTEEEDEGIEIDNNCTRSAREIGKNCVLMKILTHKSISIEALRKNMRMLWKPNKSVQISEIDEEIFLVEFGDGRDKKKVLDMCPWSYEKQLILIQEFDGKLTPKEVDIRWAPFWIQIYNLPLNCRTKEIGLAIGARMGEVLEIDVQESGVHWGTCLRVRVRIDVTKKLVRGKKITVEGGDSRWVNFKYERLPNFCYRCGLLNHALKECPETGENNKSTEEEVLQYGAWMRGEIFRRYAQDQNRPSMGRGMGFGAERWGAGTESEKGTMILSATEPPVEMGGVQGLKRPGMKERPLNQWGTRAETEKTTANTTAKDLPVGLGGAHRSRQPSMEAFPLTQQKVASGDDATGSVGLHANGMCEEIAEKKGLKVPDLGVDTLLKDKSQTTELESMICDESIDQKKKVVRKEKLIQVQVKGVGESKAKKDIEESNGPTGPMGLQTELGPLAMVYDENKGWTEEKLGQNSRHWKRLARELKKESKGENKGLKNVKRESQTPLSEIDPNVIDTKRRKEGGQDDIQNRRNYEEENLMVGGEAGAARQHRRAS